jgi:hypothetical protein
MLLRGNGANNATNSVVLDSSTNNFTMTNVSASFATLVQTSVTPFNTAFTDYNTSMGGSLYSSGNSNMTYTGTTFGTGNYTIDFWFNSGSFAVVRIPISTSLVNGLGIRIINTTSISIDRFNDSAQSFTVPTMSVNTWYHVVIVRGAANATTVFLNGTRSTTGAVTMAQNYSGATNAIGGTAAASGNRFLGYLSNVRLVTGTALFDPTASTITVPTEPTTAVAGTQLLLNFTNGGVIDSTSRNLVGLDADARISTTQSRFGGSSIFTDSVGDRLVIPTTSGALTQGLSFTYETWVYYAALPTTGFQNVFGAGNAGQNTFGMRVNNARFNVNVANVGDVITSTTVVAINTWYHVAAVRDDSTTRLYVNGVNEGAIYTGNAGTKSFNNNPLTIGLGSNAYFDDFRISNVARYTANFTPPGAL